MRVWSVGAGAVGGTVAARLRSVGVDPLVLDAGDLHVSRSRDPGLHLTGRWDGPSPVPLDAWTPREAAAAGRLRPAPDLILLAVRSGATVDALDAVLPHAGSAQVVSLQNGLNEDRIVALVGPARTVGCVVGFGATWLGPGEVAVTSGGGLTLGRLDATSDPALAAVAALLGRALPVQVTDNVLGALWGKVLVNSVTVLGAAAGLLTGELLADPGWRAAARAVLAEGVAVAGAEGVRLAKVLELVEPAVIAGRRPGWEAELDTAFDAMAAFFGDVKSVTWRDLELGRPIEIDAVTGEVVARGRHHGVATPVSSGVYGLLRAIERGERESSPANVAGLLG